MFKDINTTHLIIDKTRGHDVSRNIEDLNHTVTSINLIDITEHSMQQQIPLRFHSFQVYWEHLLRESICWPIKQVSISLKTFQLCKACCLTTEE